MAKALRLTRSGNLNAATRLIQSTLRQAGGGYSSQSGPARGIESIAAKDALQRYLPASPAPTPAAAPKTQAREARIARPGVTPAQGSFDARLTDRADGGLAYWLYLPARPAHGLPLVVMLHGCTQTPEDFARGTGMNLLAEELGFIVAYPEQPASANISRCWNWFKPGDQQRDKGEPAAITAMTRAILAETQADASRVYVAGLSAGGAAAAILGSAYPDVYAAIGVHSGLACGAATDMMSAFAAMRSGSAQSRDRGRSGRFVPVITFHGDGDSTVHAVNSAQIVANAAERIGTPLTITSQTGDTTGGRAYTREMNSTADGTVQIEQWTIHGAGHAWSGGHASGTYTDAGGPDASRAMVDFFLTHSLASAR